MRNWEVQSSEQVVQNRPYIIVRKDRCVLPNGMEIDYYVNEYPNWVNGVVLTKDRELVLVRQYRHGVGEVVLETPGGMVNDGEDPAHAIVREVAEETGYRSRQAPVFLGEFYPNPATNNNKVSTYLFLDAELTEEQHLDSTEDIAVTTIPFHRFGQMVREGKVPQMFSAFGYYLAKDYLLVYNVNC